MDSNSIGSWAEYLSKERGLTLGSIRLMTSHLRQIGGDLEDPRVLHTDDIRTWLHSKGGSASTFSSRLTSCRSFYRWLVITKQRIDDPTTGIQAPKKRRGLPRPVENLDGIFPFLDDLDRRNNLNAAKMACLNTRPVGETRAMAVFLAETGLRIFEAVTLVLAVPTPEQLRIVGKGGKHAFVPLTDDARDAWDFLGGGWPLGIRGTQRRFKEAGFTPHQLRHLRATSMAAAGCDLGDIQTMLRHESADTTRVYTAWSTDRVRDALAKVKEKKSESIRPRLRIVN